MLKTLATGNGELIVSCEELSMCKDELELQFMAKKLDKKDFFGSSDPFLIVSRDGFYKTSFRPKTFWINFHPPNCGLISTQKKQTDSNLHTYIIIIDNILGC
jgi:hypothetical protein